MYCVTDEEDADGHACTSNDSQKRIIAIVTRIRMPPIEWCLLVPLLPSSALVVEPLRSWSWSSTLGSSLF
jgi:hypothetical protein